MQYIGVHLGHDAGIVAFDEAGEVIFYGQCERYSRFKNHMADLDPIGQSFPNIPQASSDDVIAITSMENWFDPKWRDAMNVSPETIGYDKRIAIKYKPLQEENFIQKWLGKNPDFYVGHHIAHTLSAWAFRKDDKERLFLSYDGVGLDATNKLDCCLVGYIGNNTLRIIDDKTQIPSTISMGGILGYNSAGKAMGLAGHMPKQDFTLEQLPAILNAHLNDKWYPCFPYFDKPKESDYQIIANFYRYTTNNIWLAVKANIEKFGNGNGVVISGGSTLALEVNSKIHEMTNDVVFGPPTDDSGQALGAAMLAYYHHNKKWPVIKTASLNCLQDPLPAIGPQDPIEIAKLIASNKVVGLLRENSEAGPRALGFRSILALPLADNLKRVSQRIKKREFYRPLAPVVTERQFDELFKGPIGEYMQYRCDCTDIAKKSTPAIVHKDNTSRPQVVFKEKDPWLHSLLEEIGKLTGYECLINTSLNSKDKPICNTYEDAKKELRHADIELVSIACPAWEIKKKLRFV